MLRRITFGLVVGAMWLPLAPVASAAPPAAPFVLAQGEVEGSAVVGDVPGFGAAMATIKISGTRGTGGSIPIKGSVSKLPFTGQSPMPYKATGDFSMTGTVDAATGAVTGTFTWEVPDIATTPWDVTSNDVVEGQMWMNTSLTWSGDVTGTVDADMAELAFSGSLKSDCTTTYKGVEVISGNASDLNAPVTTTTFHNCTGPTGAYEVLVTFAVAGAAETEAPGGPATEPLGVTRDVSGDVYISPASEADLEPGARHFQRVKPGQRLALEEGAMLRTGRDGTVTILHATGALTRLGPSTLLGMQKFEPVKTSQWVMYGRLFEGIAWFYMQKWKESGKKFEVETDRANTSIQGTTYQIAVTDAATVVTVAEGVVTVTDKATGTTIDVGANERATVDASGMTKTAAPDAAALLDDNAVPGASAPAGASPPTAGPATPAAVAAASSGAGAAASAAPEAPSGGDAGGSSLPIVLGIVAAVVVLVALVAAILLRRRRT